MSGPPGSLPTLPGFRLVRELGRGGMGIVYEAWSEARERPVALKLLHAGGALDPDAVARLQREVAAQARLDHPNLIAVVDVGLRGSTPWVALELVRGESLARILERGPLDPRGAAIWARQLAQALSHAHARGVLHRDLKPANVLIDERGQPRLADLGLALLSDEAARLTASGVILGTPAYMAPEQASGQRLAPDPRTDVYGLGAVLYEMLCGAPPFRGASHLEVLQAVLTLPPPPPSQLRPGLDPRLEALCLRCLAKAPDQRPPDAQALADALAEWLAAPPAPPSRPVAPLVAAGLAIGLAAAGAWLVLRSADRAALPARAAPDPPAAPSAPSPALPPLAAARAAWAEGDLGASLALLERAAEDEEPARRAEALFRWHLQVLVSEPGRLIDSPRRLSTPPLEALLELPPEEPWSTLARVTKRVHDQPLGCARVLRGLEPICADEPGLWLLLALACQRDDVEQAWRRLERARGLETRPVLADLLLFRLSNDRGELQRADEHLGSAAANLDGASARAARSQVEAQRSTLFLRAGQPERARTAAERAVELAPSAPPARALRTLAALRLSQGDEEGARAHLSRAAQAGGERLDEVDVELELAELWQRELLDEGRARARLAALAGRYPDDPRVSSARGCLLLHDDPQAALALLDTLPAEVLPREALRTRQALRRNARDRQGAARDMDLLLARWPDEPVMRQMRAKQRLGAADLQGALEDYDHLVAHGSHPGLRLERALARRPIDPAGALADLEWVEAEAELLDPDSLRQLAVQLANLGLQLDRPDLLDRSLGHLDRLVSIAPRDVDARASRAAALYNRGRFAEAAREATRVLELAPAGTPQARSTRSTRSLARERAGDPAGARADLEVLLQDCAPDERPDLEARLARLPR